MLREQSEEFQFFVGNWIRVNAEQCSCSGPDDIDIAVDGRCLSYLSILRRRAELSEYDSKAISKRPGRLSSQNTFRKHIAKSWISRTQQLNELQWFHEVDLRL